MKTPSSDDLTPSFPYRSKAAESVYPYLYCKYSTKEYPIQEDREVKHKICIYISSHSGSQRERESERERTKNSSVFLLSPLLPKQNYNPETACGNSF